tara:strand:+ start:61 stop:615 length:555 start_codon:yes stop_codon:yes gene_type:complete
MRKLLIPFLAAITFTYSAESREINCNSPVHKKSDLCKEKIKQLRKSSIRPSNNDLGGADITGPYGGSTTGNVYAAWCGKDFIDCDVSFKDDRLSVNNGTGITREQLVRVTMERVCRIRTFGIEDCIKSTKNKEYTITYKTDLDQERSALISFRNEKTYKNFNRDFQIWMGEVLRDVGPSLKIEF